MAGHNEALLFHGIHSPAAGMYQVPGSDKNVPDQWKKDRYNFRTDRLHFLPVRENVEERWKRHLLFYGRNTFHFRKRE